MLPTSINHRLSVIALLLLSTGCASWSGNGYYQPAVKPGSIVQVNQTFEIPNELARVYFQHGAQIAKNQRDKYLTYCSILMQNIHAVDQTPQQVLTGEFVVGKVLEGNDLQPYDRTYVATSLVRRIRHPSNIIYTLEMRLKSDQQPGVRALICAKWVNAFGRRHYPTLPEIRAALGDLVTIQAPAN